MSSIPRGGRRTGKVGATYSNRTDLQGAGLHSAQYGEGTARAASTAAVPVAPPAPPPVPPADAPSGPAPGSLGGLLDPTARPDEPLTAGAPFGPGPGPSLGMPTGDDIDLDNLRAIYAANPSPALRDLVEFIAENRP